MAVESKIVAPVTMTLRDSYSHYRGPGPQTTRLPWRGDLGGFTRSEKCPDGILHDVDICGFHTERQILIEAIERWLHDA